MSFKTTMIGALACLAAAGLGSPARAAPMGDVNDPIKLAVLEWTGQHVTTHIVGQLLTKMGYKIDYVTAGNFPEFTGLADGTIDASVEVWMNNVGDIFPKVLADKKIADVGSLGLKTEEGWIYPKYMEQVCPGLPDWTALTKPDCVKKLSTPDTFPKARLLDYPADWGSRSAQIIQDNNLPYEAISAGSEGALVAELMSANAAKTPLVMMFWGPHYALAAVDVGWVKMPPCKSDDNAHCINPPDVEKIVWSGFQAKWPAAYDLIKAVKVDATEQEQMMLDIDKKNQDIDAVTKQWIDTHRATWQPWIDAAKK
ncbi:MAG TPA: ABC transporter substrate-binding protein [Lichenihabitans sp.]|jgi:glycine betaine/proline transport system substrate-binding protein|nr:ABC transporter substrate-binding protein [Lichenihabitans sp.]